jgi:hypothetical protein
MPSLLFPLRRLRRVAATLLVVGFLTLASASGAYAWSVFIYWSNNIDPGSWIATGHAYRLYNKACRDGNSGQMSVKYMTNFSIVVDSGTQWTNCQQGAIVQITTDGYYQARCDNDGTVTFDTVCQTTNPD